MIPSKQNCATFNSAEVSVANQQTPRTGTPIEMHRFVVESISGYEMNNYCQSLFPVNFYSFPDTESI